jgi:hypothetical protein
MTSARGFCLLPVALVAMLFGCVSGRPTAAVVPASVQVPADRTLLLRARAIGVQIYVCEATPADPTRFDWVFKAPEAELTDRSGKLIIRHFAGPSWQAPDGSTVVGEVVAKDNGPDPMAIPWLLLRAKSTTGTGVLSGTQNIQRLNTVGGKAPAGGCGAGLAGSEVRVHYTADYLFYR